MKMIATSITLAAREIQRNLLRSFLTTLGIIIGVSSVVTLVNLGEGTNRAVQSQIATLGANLLTISPGSGSNRGGGGAVPPRFEYDDLSAIREQIVGVDLVIPMVQSSGTAVFNAANWSTSITGTNRDYFTAQQWNIEKGRTFSLAEDQSGKLVCIIGEKIRQQLFRDDDPIGKTLRLRDISCLVIGLLAERGQSGPGGNQDDVVILPIKAVQRRITGTRTITSIMVSTNSAYDTEKTKLDIKALLRERRNIEEFEQDNFNIFDTKQIADTLNTVTGALTALVAAVAAVSLLVGGIGIMNIMLVSVTERTREIGIRLAIGALANEVLLQFLIEAVVLSCFGGLMGLLLALLATWGISSLLIIPQVFMININLMAFGVSALIGIVFGYAPARRAARLNPIDALRHE
jgi:putative ABC transport system permease protein